MSTESIPKTADPVRTPPPGAGCGCSATVSTVDSPDATVAPCCGTAAQAHAEGACCGAAARDQAVAAGASCCG